MKIQQKSSWIKKEVNQFNAGQMVTCLRLGPIVNQNKTTLNSWLVGLFYKVGGPSASAISKWRVNAGACLSLIYASD
jgi:hypothetical protein